jgi:2-keto-4-pentenoate hydratase/2-oxohepta-3-ene-1,7-dioic acid hydratase in catechol pathway
MIKNIYCIGRNYTEHAKELGNNIEEEPIVFSKPNTSSIDGKIITLPSFSNEIHFETELVIKISDDCFELTEYEAENFYSEIAIGLDLTARDIQSKLKEKKLPWLLSKGFKGSYYISEFVNKKELNKNINFHMELNNILVQKGDSRNMIFSFGKIISFISRYIRLEKNDVIYTGTPAGVGRLSKGDEIKLFIEDKLISELNVK